MSAMFIYLIPVFLISVFLISVVLILLVLFFIRTEKAAYDKLKFGFMDEFAGHTDGNVPVNQPTPIVHERTSRLPEELEDESLEESEDLDELSEEQEELPWEE